MAKTYNLWARAALDLELVILDPNLRSQLDALADSVSFSPPHPLAGVDAHTVSQAHTPNSLIVGCPLLLLPFFSSLLFSIRPDLSIV